MYQDINPLEPRLSSTRAVKPATKEKLLSWLQLKIPKSAAVGGPILVMTNFVEIKQTSCSITHGTYGHFLVTNLYFGRIDQMPVVGVEDILFYFQTAGHTLVCQSRTPTAEKGRIEIYLTSLFSPHGGQVDLLQPIPKDQGDMFWRNQCEFKDYLPKLEACENLDVYPIEIVVGDDQIREFCARISSTLTSHYLSFLSEKGASA